MAPNRPTIKDVAALAGVSKSLVSLAMRGSDRVSAESRAAIIEAAAQLGYRPNAAARSLADRRSHTLGVVVLDLLNPIYAEIIDPEEGGIVKRDMFKLWPAGRAFPKFEYILQSYDVATSEKAQNDPPPDDTWDEDDYADTGRTRKVNPYAV